MDNNTDLHDKREKVLSGHAKISSSSIVIVVLISLMVAGGIFISRMQAKGSVPPPKKVARLSISKPLNYADKRYDMTAIEVGEDKDNIIIPLAKVEKNRIVSFRIKAGGIVVEERNFGKRSLPMLAYITPSGNLVTAIAYCEPCRSIYFHTETDMTLTCHVCNTKWNLESLQAISGACMPYPPAEIKARVAGGNIYLKKKDISSWKPRVEI